MRCAFDLRRVDAALTKPFRAQADTQAHLPGKFAIEAFPPQQQHHSSQQFHARRAFT